MRDRSLSRSSHGFKPRKVDTKSPEKLFLIVCEGGETEKNYFDSLKRRLKFPANVVDVRGIGYNTLSLVEQATELKDAGNYDQVWCVFDRDDFPAKNFNSALALAEQEGMQVAYSNEAFELWYLLHFAYHDTGMSRTVYEDKLTHCLGTRYAKNSEDMFGRLEAKQADAIRNAERLLNPSLELKVIDYAGK
jgi:hypothetical protein